MDVFRLRHRLVDDYGSYVSSFIRIKDDSDRRRRFVTASARACCGPTPSYSSTPRSRRARPSTSWWRRAPCTRSAPVSSAGSESFTTTGEDLRLHRHQADAIRTARAGHNYVLTTGTGSGKSLAYIVPVVDHVLRRGPGRGIQAIVVYPMNALANSQYGELEKFLNYGYPDGKGPVTFARYTGQESDEERQRIIANPPDILLTNYVMLELILTRSAEQGLVRAAQDLGFLVFDELHTYRGGRGRTWRS